MKATGIVRRIDDLGRVVVPKELRDSLKIHEGDTIEIFTDEHGEIVLKKYSPMAELDTVVQSYADTLADSTGHPSIITDKDHVVATSDELSFLKRRPVGNLVKQVFHDRKTMVISKTEEPREIIDSLQMADSGMSSFVISPVISPAGDLLGAVILTSKEKTMADFEVKIAETASSFLSKQVEVD